MNKTPLFSVLIANYNNANYIEEAIYSVFKQTYSNWEIIIVDDASTDNSHKLYEKYKKDKRINIYYNPINKGCGFTKYKCVENAKGDYCGFLDPDDALLPNAIEIMVNSHLAHPKASIIFSRHYVCDINLNILSESRKYNQNGYSYFETKDFHAEHFVSFKLSSYKKTNGLNIHYKAGVDADLNFILEEIGELKVIDDITYKYRKNVGYAVTANYSKSQFWNILVQYDTCKRRNLDIEEHVYDFYLSSVEYAQNEMIKNAEDKVRKSKAYRLGRFLLNPISFIFKKKK